MAGYIFTEFAGAPKENLTVALRLRRILSALTVAVVSAGAVLSAAAPEAPAFRPSSRSQAIAVLVASPEPSHPCLTPLVTALRGDAAKSYELLEEACLEGDRETAMLDKLARNPR